MKLKISAADQLSTQFKSLRKAKGWSQSELGKRLGLKQARIAQIEGDPGSISVDKLLQILHVLGADLYVEAGQENLIGLYTRHEILPQELNQKSDNYVVFFHSTHVGPKGKGKKSLNLIGSPGKSPTDEPASDAPVTQSDKPAKGAE